MIRIDDLTFYPNDVVFSYTDGVFTYDFSSGQIEGKVLTYEDNPVAYPPGQVGNHVFSVRATLRGDSQLISGQQLYFRIIDPLDTAPYRGPHAVPDNDDNSGNAGKFVASGLATQSATTDSAGNVDLSINTTGQFAGDNYVVQATSDQRITTDPNFQCGADCFSTATLTAWKRVYLEVDSMFRKGAFITSVVNPGDTIVKVSSTTSDVYPTQTDVREMGFLWRDRSDALGAPLKNTHHVIGGSQQNGGANVGFRVNAYHTAWVWLETIEAYRVPSGGTRTNFVARHRARNHTHVGRQLSY